MARDDRGCLPSVGALRRIQWPLRPRSRDRRAAFRLPRDDRSMTISRHRGSDPDLRPEHGRPHPRSRRPFARSSRRRFTADDGSELGPRSLAPSLFWEPCARAYSRPDVRLPTSATVTTCGHFDQDSRVLAGTVAATTFLFFLRIVLPPFRERRCVASCAPSVMTSPRCRFLSVARACPTAMSCRPPDRPRVAPRSVEPGLTCTGLRTE